MTCAALCASWTGGGVAVRFVTEQLAFTSSGLPRTRTGRGQCSRSAIS